ncbi:MAG: hypothetical protein M3203_15685, partial [Actinomycetota bacterium]|nr:hypothetical protein [Actinomycetota bacterium]
MAAITAGVVAEGAYHPGAQRVVALLVGAAVVLDLSSRPRPISGRLRGLESAAGLLAAWALLTSTLTGRPARAVPVVALLAGVVGLARVSSRTTPGQRRAFAAVLVAVGVAVALTGWVGVAFRLRPWAEVHDGLWRAATTLTYANAAGAVLVPLALVALAIAATARCTALDAAATVLLAGVGATLSRGAVLALAAGFVVLAVALGTASALRAIAPVVCGALVALAGLAPSMGAAASPRPAMALSALGAGVGLAVVLGRARTLLPCALVAGGVIVAATVTGAPSSVAGRFAIDSPDRVAAAKATLAHLRARPVTGVGPGGATPVWIDTAGRTVVGHYAHNEYLQVTTELGLIGGGLVIAFMMAGGAVVRHGRPSLPTDPAFPVWAGAASGLVALVTHSGFDFLWH